MAKEEIIFHRTLFFRTAITFAFCFFARPALAQDDCYTWAEHTALTEVKAIVLKPGMWKKVQMATANENGYLGPDYVEGDAYFYRGGSQQAVGMLLRNGNVEIQRIANALGKGPAHCVLVRKRTPWMAEDEKFDHYLRMKVHAPTSIYGMNGCIMDVSIGFEIHDRSPKELTPFTDLICTNGTQEEGPVTRELVQKILGGYFDVYGPGERLPDGEILEGIRKITPAEAAAKTAKRLREKREVADHQRSANENPTPVAPSPQIRHQSPYIEKLE